MAVTLPAELPGDDSPIARMTMRRVSLRLLPFIFLLYIFNYLDRTNVGVAALQMNRDLAFSPAAYSFGAGVFFFGYALFEVPSNLFLARVGPRWWIARIMVSWGLIASAMMFVKTPVHFYILRFLLGVAEAGFFPGIVYYLGLWYPASQRARATSRFMVAIPLSNTLGGLLAGWLLSFDGKLGLAGWQWLFVLEGLPSVFLGISVLAFLTNKPEDATWLTDDQRTWLAARLQRDEDVSMAPHGLPPLRALFNVVLWLTALPYLLSNTAGYGYQFWGPTIIRDALHTTNSQTGFVVAIIGAVAAINMLGFGASSDRRGERFFHAATSTGLIALGFAGAALLPTPILRVCSLALVHMGSTSFLVSYFCLPPMAFRGSSLAVAIALVNSIGNMGGFFGPTIIAKLVSATGSNTGAFLSMSGIALLASILLISLRWHPTYAAARVAASRAVQVTDTSTIKPENHV